MSTKEINIITHRGLDPDRSDFPAESSKEAFAIHLSAGFGLEFDFNLTKDNKIVIFHDADLKRITNGANLSKFADLTRAELEALILGSKGSHYCFLDELLTMIEQSPAPMSALHLKGKFQSDNTFLDILLACLNRHKAVLDRLLVFDITLPTAKYLKAALPEINLAPSVAHPYDIERYNQCVLGTLLSVEEVIDNQDLFSWVWLDEWDLADKDGGQKKFYTEEVFKTFKDAGIKIALVTPELHGTSPGLLGGEAHPDAVDSRLYERISQIIKLAPDALCTDHPGKVWQIMD